MPRSRFGTAVAAVTLAVVGYIGFRPVGPLPPLGPLLDPANGLWASAASADLPAESDDVIAALGSDVRVVYDDRGVPHIFASNTLDAYRALGYVVARDRLFQLDLQSRVGGGTLTELVGARALALDQPTRALGMPRAAEQRVATADTTSVSWRLATAYGDGINAWVSRLRRRDFPLEYKLLGREPRLWTPLDMMHLLNQMGRTLASSDDELQQLRAAALVGREAAQAFFPVSSPIVEPIQPNGQNAPRVDAVTLPGPGTPDPDAVAMVSAMGGLQLASLGIRERAPDAVGSNNWAVAPSRSASGNALLAGDPHLELTLPSIWYEAHLVVPDSLDAYGVSIPGLPGIVIGFNRDVAWTFTNVGADVMDFYRETVDDPISPTQYQLDGAWVPLERRVERYFDPDGDLLTEDTLRFTHRGPLRRINSVWISHRWTVLEGANEEIAASAAATRATSARGLLDTMAAMYFAPAQNMLAADRGGVIGIRSTGRYPVRPGDGLGNILRDGSTRASDWIGDWTVAEYPQSLSPQQGFLASANQQPQDPRNEPRYLGANWERPWRAMRINTLLRGNERVTADDMRQYQTDPGSARADRFVPAFVGAARGAPMSSPLAQAAAYLGQWDRRYTRENVHALLFERAMTELSNRLWDEFRSSDSLVVDRAPRPSDMMTAVLLDAPDSEWWDDRGTDAIEQRDDILAQALEAAYTALVAVHGEPDATTWRWSTHRVNNINHLLRLPGLGRTNISMQGGPALLNPSSGSGTHGASWRMVAELGAEVTVQAIYPGGQSGHPASRRYDDRLQAWIDGRLDTLRVPRSEAELPAAQRQSVLRLGPSR